PLPLVPAKARRAARRGPMTTAFRNWRFGGHRFPLARERPGMPSSRFHVTHRGARPGAHMIRMILLAAAVLQGGGAQAQAWPEKPIRVVVPCPAGSSADVVARILGNELSARLGQQLVVDNRPGASGNIGSDVVAKAAPDGYTIGFGTTST